MNYMSKTNKDKIERDREYDTLKINMNTHLLNEKELNSSDTIN